MEKHIFAICAYKESEFLEECIVSLKNQTIISKIILVTSTPNEYIKRLCEKYDIEMFCNYGEKGITQDWNFAYEKANAQYVTIAHQDDVYNKNYVKNMINFLDCEKNPIIYFSNYGEIRNGKKIDNNKLLKIKRIMLKPLQIKSFWKSKFIRRRILSLGCPICCPSVTFVKENCPSVIFEHGFRADEDWQAWEKLSKMKGLFVYDRQILVYHRIHQNSETSIIINDDARKKEDLIMFKKFWPKCIASIITKIYGLSEKSNKLI